MGEIFVVLSLFVLFFACILIMITTGRKFFNVTTIFEYERGLKYYKGKFVEVLNPGQYWIFSLNSVIKKVDIRPTYVTITGQEVLTADGVSIKVSIAVNYKVIDPVVAIHKAEDYTQALYVIFQLALREIIGTGKLDEILEKRNGLSEKLKEFTIEQIKELGLELYKVSIKDITFNSELKKAYTQVIRAQKEGLANLEKARGETAALRNLANTAKMLENNPALLHLRILQALGETSGNTIVLNLSGDGLPLQIKNANKEE